MIKKEDKKYTPDYCITFWNTKKREIEEGEHPKIFSDSFQAEEMINYCNKMIEKNKEDLK
jgi:predicted flavoprotein YhiN